MIVVIGVPVLVDRPDAPLAGGSAGRVATEIARTGTTVQLAGRIGDDPDGDRLVIALAAAGVGHAAVLRDAARRTPVVRVAPAPDALEGLPVAPSDGREPDAVELLEPIGQLAEMPPDDGRAVGWADEDASAIELAAGPQLDAGDLELALRYLVEFRVLVVATPLDAASASVVAEAASYAGAQVIAITADETPPAELGLATVLDAPKADPDGTFARFVAAFAVALDGGSPAADAFRGALDGGGWEAVAP